MVAVQHPGDFQEFYHPPPHTLINIRCCINVPIHPRCFLEHVKCSSNWSPRSRTDVNRSQWTPAGVDAVFALMWIRLWYESWKTHYLHYYCFARTIVEIFFYHPHDLFIYLFIFITFSPIGSTWIEIAVLSQSVHQVSETMTGYRFLPGCVRSLVSVLASGLYMERFILSCVDWLEKTHVSLTCVHSAGWPQCWRRLR